MDSKIDKVADILVNYCAKVKKGDKVWITANSPEADPWFKAVRVKVIQNGAFPYEHFMYDSQGEGMDRDWMEYASDAQLKTVSQIRVNEMKAMDAFIGIGSASNTRYLAGMPPSRISLRKQTLRKVMDERLKTRWVITRYPTHAFAQEAGMSTEEFSDFVYGSIIGIDWEKQKKMNERVKKIFDNAREVRITGKETDLSFSLKGRTGRCDNGECNMPGGEVFYAPVHSSVRGHIKYSHPVIDSGNEIDGIYLEFDSRGRISSVTAAKGEDFLQKMIATDDGAHFIGEFGIGNNAKIDRYIKNMLFDEKIGGTVHITPGAAYDDCVGPDDPYGINKSAIHWDIVKDLRKQAGGGKIMVNGKVVQKDGRWMF